MTTGVDCCPHCGEPYGEPVHVCADNRRWTDGERDAWRERARRLDPSIRFAPSSERLGTLFGERNRTEPKKHGTQPRAGA